jgi:hypothetical protein
VRRGAATPCVRPARSCSVEPGRYVPSRGESIHARSVGSPSLSGVTVTVEESHASHHRHPPPDRHRRRPSPQQVEPNISPGECVQARDAAPRQTPGSVLGMGKPSGSRRSLVLAELCRQYGFCTELQDADLEHATSAAQVVDIVIRAEGLDPVMCDSQMRKAMIAVAGDWLLPATSATPTRARPR